MALPAGASLLFWNFGYTYAASYTYVFHVILIGQCGGVLLLMFYFFTRGISKNEKIGLAAILIGFVALITTKSEAKISGTTNVLYGDLVSLCAAFGGLSQMLIAAVLVRKTPPLIGFVMMITCISLLYTLGIPIIAGWHTLSMDPVHGIFGWLDNWRLALYTIIVIGLVMQALSMGSYFIALRSISPVVV